MDAKTCYCPNRACRSYGIQGQDSHIVHRGFDNSIQRLQCAMCKTTFSIRQGTAYLGIRSDEAVFTIATRALAEGNSIRGTGRIVDGQGPGCFLAGSSCFPLHGRNQVLLPQLAPH